VIGWQVKRLGDAIKLEYGKPLPDEDRDDAGAFPAYGANGIKCRTNKFFFARPSIIVGRKGSAGELTLTDKKFWPLDVTYYVTFDERQYDLMYLYYCLGSLKLTGLAKGVKPGLNRNDVYSIKVAFPPLPEQKRIVAILDEAFEGIAAATANAEKNLANARELFESYLNSVFTTEGKGWEEKTLQQVTLDFGRGKSKHRPRNDPKLYGGPYPFIQTGDVRNCDHIILDSSQSYNEMGLAQSKLWPKGTICVTIAANIAETGILGFDSCFPDSVIGIVVDQAITTNDFVEYLLQSVKALLKAQGKGSAQDNINLGTFENRLFPFPPLSEQKKIVIALNQLSEHITNLEDCLEQKLSALEELKQSILQKAFAGDLTRDFSKQTAALVPKAQDINTRTPQFSACVLAFSYDRHDSKKRGKTFGRVKAQKNLHLVESIGGIELGRQPIKDAAGPNDFQHMLRAEEWAKENQFFRFEKKGSGYEFKKLAHYDEMIVEALNSIGPCKDKLQKVIDLILPMDSREAEVFATVHAAWNNLVLDKAEISDAHILYEARENWHPDKLKIPEEAFKKAISLIRDKGLIPDGSAKRVVGGQGSFSF